MTTPAGRVRPATAGDAAGCAAVYAPYVLGTAVTFEVEPPTAQEMARRVAAAQRTHAWLVLVDEQDRVRGYAYGGPHKERAAYRWTCEVSVYLEQGLRRRGAGRALYGALLPALAGRGYRRVVAGTTLPNDASEGLHRALGFEAVGTFHRVGHKAGRWHDVLWLERALGPDGGHPDSEHPDSEHPDGEPPDGEPPDELR